MRNRENVVFGGGRWCYDINSSMFTCWSSNAYNTHVDWAIHMAHIERCFSPNWIKLHY